MISDDLFPALAAGAREAVWEAFVAAHHSTRHRLPEEVEHVHALVSTGTSRLAGYWRPVLSARGVSLRVTGVLIHQTPKAQYDHPTDGTVRPELGDLLVVHDHLAATHSRRALLLQAKRMVSGVPTSTPDRHQEFLYRHWPDFSLKGHGASRKAGKYLPGDRNIRPNSGGSWYGLVADDADAHSRCTICHFQPAYVFPWLAADPAGSALAAGADDLGNLLANMLYTTVVPRGRDARPIAGALALSSGMPNNHFDVTVEELLRLTAARTASFKRYPHIRGTRGQAILCFQDASPGGPPLPATGDGFQVSGDGEFDRYEAPPLSEEDDDGGMSVLLIETGAESRG